MIVSPKERPQADDIEAQNYSVVANCPFSDTNKKAASRKKCCVDMQGESSLQFLTGKVIANLEIDDKLRMGAVRPVFFCQS